MDVTKETQTNEFCLLSQFFFFLKINLIFNYFIFFKKNNLAFIAFCHIFNIKLSPSRRQIVINNLIDKNVILVMG